MAMLLENGGVKIKDGGNTVCMTGRIVTMTVGEYALCMFSALTGSVYNVYPVECIIGYLTRWL